MDIDSAIVALAVHSEVLESVLGIGERGLLTAPTSLRSLASLVGISSTKLPQLQQALQAGIPCSVFRTNKSGDWSLVCTDSELTVLRTMLSGINVYKTHVHKALDDVTVVISKPAHPSQLVEMLERSLEGFTGMQTTAHALIDLAHRAKRRFTVMTPFIDDAGISRIVELFESVGGGVVKELIVRRPIPDALVKSRDNFMRMGVHVMDFRISKEEAGEHETFHAKVVRIDDDECYVGSSNMTQWSFNYSLELGFLVRGAAGRRVSQVLDAVQRVSLHVQL